MFNIPRHYGALSGRLSRLWTFLVFFILAMQAAAQELPAAPPGEETPGDEYFTRATALLLEQQYDESISLFQCAEEEYHAVSNMRQTVACYLGIGFCYFSQGNFRESLRYNEYALALHNRAISDDPEGLEMIQSSIFLCKTVLDIN